MPKPTRGASDKGRQLRGEVSPGQGDGQEVRARGSLGDRGGWGGAGSKATGEGAASEALTGRS